MTSEARKKKQTQKIQKKTASTKNSAYIIQDILQQSEHKTPSAIDSPPMPTELIERKEPVFVDDKMMEIPTINCDELNSELIYPNISTPDNPITAKKKSEQLDTITAQKPPAARTLFYEFPIIRFEDLPSDAIPVTLEC